MKKYISTIGVDFGVKPVRIQNREVRVNFWDLSGHDEFYEVRNEFYKDTQGALLVFDLGDQLTFDNLEKWLDEAKNYGLKSMTCVVCGNKSDTQKVVPSESIKEWCAKHDYRYFETSAKSGDSVKTAFDTLFDLVVERASIGRRPRSRQR